MSALFTQQLLLSLTSAASSKQTKHNIPSHLLATEVWKYYCWPIFLIKYHQKWNWQHLPPVCRQFNHPKQWPDVELPHVAHHHPDVGPDDVPEGRGVIGDPQQCYNGILTSNVDTGRWFSCQIRVKLKVRGIICTRGSMLYKQTGTEVLSFIFVRFQVSDLVI